VRSRISDRTRGGERRDISEMIKKENKNRKRVLL
jgi:hypothetical protein